MALFASTALAANPAASQSRDIGMRMALIGLSPPEINQVVSVYAQEAVTCLTFFALAREGLKNSSVFTAEFSSRYERSQALMFTEAEAFFSGPELDHQTKRSFADQWEIRLFGDISKIFVLIGEHDRRCIEHANDPGPRVRALRDELGFRPWASYARIAQGI
ncbi:MAG: hypothetical protein O7C63_03485 [Alphaproteobacteria bacterium]|nr:hypothetical protein [Alphaproteobacteria bacterium]